MVGEHAGSSSLEHAALLQSEVTSQRDHILRPIGEGWKFDHNAGYPTVEIATQLAARHSVLHVFLNRAHDSKVDVKLQLLPEPLDFTCIERTKELGLPLLGQ